MNRRNFFGNLAKAVACFTILPSATTYARQWVALDSGVIAPGYCDITDMRFQAAFKYYLRPMRLDYARYYLVPVDKLWTSENFAHA